MIVVEYTLFFVLHWRRNIWKRAKAITNFKKEDDIKVIMLSLRNAASGTNLIEATHVILMGE